MIPTMTALFILAALMVSGIVVASGGWSQTSPCAGITQVRFLRSAAGPAALSARGHELPLCYPVQAQGSIAQGEASTGGPAVAPAPR